MPPSAKSRVILFNSLFILMGSVLVVVSGVLSPDNPVRTATESGTQQQGQSDPVVEEERASYEESPQARFGAWLTGESIPAYLKEQVLEAMSQPRGEGEAAEPESASVSDIMGFLMQVTLDHEEAEPYVALIRAAAVAGEPEAMRSLADLMEMGLAESADASESFWLYHTAAEAGDVVAARQVGFCYEQGIGVASDPAKAVEWYERAAEGGYPEALVDLGFLHASRALGEPDLEAAHRYYDLAAGAGVARGLYFKAVDFVSGWESQPGKLETAIALLEQAASRQSGEAHYALGMLFGNEDFGMVDPERSFAHLLVAANLDNPDARYLRGTSLLRQNDDFAYNSGWTELTDLSLEGNLRAANALADELIIHEKEERLPDAISILEWAAEEGSGEAARRLLLLGMDTEVPVEQRPDAEFWLSRLGEHYPIQETLIRLYRESGMGLMESYRAAQDLSPEDQYEELFKFGNPAAKAAPEAVYTTAIPPAPVHVVKPAYPEAMRFLKIEGTVTVRMVVHTDGTTGHFEVEDSPHPDFTKAALESLRQWRFEPGSNEEGLPVATRVRVPVPFKFIE